MFSFLQLNIYTFSIFLEWITVSLDKKKKKKKSQKIFSITGQQGLDTQSI